MSGSRRRLHHFLLSAFDGAEMRRLVALDATLQTVVHDLPGPSASDAEVAGAIVEQVERRGIFGALVTAILAARPHREADIATLAVLDGPRAGSVQVHLGAPTNDVTRRLAWVAYVELATRVATADLPDDHGSLREAMTSLYKLFTLLREALLEAGPDAATPAVTGEASIAGLVVLVLNTHLRPFLACWHPRLQGHEATRADGVGQRAHEEVWEHAAEVRAELRLLQADLAGVARALAAVLDIQEGASLLSRAHPPPTSP